MFFADINRIINDKQRTQVDDISKNLSKLAEKEANLINLVENAEYTASYMSMLKIKTDFMTKDAMKLIDDINKTDMSDSVKQTHILTVGTMLERLKSMKNTLTQAETTLQTSDVIKDEAKKKELINKLMTAYGKEKR